MALVTVPEWLCWAVVSQFFVTVLAGGYLAIKVGALTDAVAALRPARREQPQDSEGW